MDLKGIKPSEINQMEKQRYFMISLLYGTLKKMNKTHQDKNRHRCRDHISGYQG